MKNFYYQKKSKNYGFAVSSSLFIFLIGMILSSCFSGWQNEMGNISINFTNSSGRSVVSDTEKGDMTYFVVITGIDGKTVEEKEIIYPSDTISIKPGKYNIAVYAKGKIFEDYRKDPNYDDDYENDDVFSDTVICGYGFNTAIIEVSSGKKTSADIKMEDVIGVDTWAQLHRVFNVVSYNDDVIDLTVLLTKSFEKKSVSEDEEYSECHFDSGEFKKNITLISHNDVTIARKSIQPFFSIGANAILTLGRQGMKGTLKLDGKSMEFEDDVIIYVSGSDEINTGQLIMNHGVTLTNNYSVSGNGGAVGIRYGSFVMNGGEISKNFAGTPASDSVSEERGIGAVYIMSGIFQMKGGKISGNNAVGTHGGGAVLVGNGEGGARFSMFAGVISDNGAAYGAGVYVYEEGYFEMLGGTVSGNEAAHGAGVYVDKNSIFEMSNGKIENNIAKYLTANGEIYGYGGGIYINESGQFLMSAGTVSGNKAGQGGGVFINNSLVVKTGGIIYGQDGGSNSNIGYDAKAGHAAYWLAAYTGDTTNPYKHYINETLGEKDSIDTKGDPSDAINNGWKK